MRDRISSIHIMPVEPRNGLVAYVSFLYDNTFLFSSIAIMKRYQGDFRLSYPPRMTPMGKMTIVHPVSKEIGHQIEEIILEKYEMMLKNI